MTTPLMKKKIKLADLVKLNLPESEIQINKGWSDDQKLQYLHPVVVRGMTEGKNIVVVNGVVVDGRQTVLTLREYLENKHGKGSLPFYNDLTPDQKNYVNNLEFEINEGMINVDPDKLFADLNRKLGE